MLVHSSGTLPLADPMAVTPRDMLSQVLLGLRLEGVEYERCLMQAPWSLAFPARSEASFHFIAQGGCWLRTSASPWRRLDPGDAVLLPHGTAHVLASAPDLPTIGIDQLARVPVAHNIYLAHGQEHDQVVAAATVMFCGSLRFNLHPSHPLLAMMPEMMHAGDLAKRDPSVPGLLEAMEREVSLDRIGACGILARLADVLAASIIRAWVECGCSDASGWLAAVQCPRIGKVMAAIHAEPERDWSVAALADLMGASRSTFAEAFTRTVGETPARYVVKVKMFQARHWLAREGMRVAAAAQRLGYDSEASFSRAFKRVTGELPSAVRGQRAPKPQDPTFGLATSRPLKSA